VALDAVVACLMVSEPERIPFFRFAKQKGLGSYEEDSYIIDGSFKPFPHFKLPKTAQNAEGIQTGEDTRFENLISLRPMVDKDPMHCLLDIR
jgi:hypothetical protein